MTLRVSRLPRSTPLGRRAGLIGLGLLLAGINTGNNLLYLIFTVLASCEIVGFLAAGRLLRRVDLRVVTPRRARAGAPTRATVRIVNRCRRLPLPPLRWRVHLSGGEELEIATPALAAGESGAATGRVTPLSRGRWSVERVEVATDYPLGLARRIAAGAANGERESLVTPRLLHAGRREAGTRRSDPVTEGRPSGRGDEPLEAREYRPGDDARRIDWKASARTERLVWRDRRGEVRPAAEIRLDRTGPPGPVFEARVSRAAGRAVRAIERGQPVGLRSDDWSLPPRSGHAQLRRILGYLALVQPRAGAPRSEEERR